MKFIFLSLAAVFLIALGWTSALVAPPAADDAQIEAAVRTIRAHYTEINGHAPQCRQVKKELAGFSSEGGAFVAFLRGDAVMKMVATFYGESGEATEEYYYWEGELILSFAPTLTTTDPVPARWSAQRRIASTSPRAG